MTTKKEPGSRNAYRVQTNAVSDSTTPAPNRQGRQVKKPYCWQAKAALNAIRAATDGTGHTTSAMAVYLALSEIASNEHSDRFQSLQSFIGSRVGLDDRTVRRRFADLIKAGVLMIHAPGPNDPHKTDIYELIDPESVRTLSPVNRTLSLEDRTRDKNASCPTVEESHKESHRESHQEKKGKAPRLFVSELDTQKRSIDELIKAIEQRGHDAPTGLEIRKEDKAQYAALKKRRRELTWEIAGMEPMNPRANNDPQVARAGGLPYFTAPERKERKETIKVKIL